MSVFIVFCTLSNWESISIHVQIEFFILCLRRKTLILWATRRFVRTISMGMEMVNGILIHGARNAHKLYTHWLAISSCWFYDLFFILFDLIWFSNGIEVPVTVKSAKAIAMQQERSSIISNSITFTSKCEMLFMFSSNACVCVVIFIQFWDNKSIKKNEQPDDDDIKYKIELNSYMKLCVAIFFRTKLMWKPW